MCQKPHTRYLFISSLSFVTLNVYYHGSEPQKSGLFFITLKPFFLYFLYFLFFSFFGLCENVTGAFSLKSEFIIVSQERGGWGTGLISPGFGMN